MRMIGLVVLMASALTFVAPASAQGEIVKFYGRTYPEAPPQKTCLPQMIVKVVLPEIPPICLENVVTAMKIEGIEKIIALDPVTFGAVLVTRRPGSQLEWKAIERPEFDVSLPPGCIEAPAFDGDFEYDTVHGYSVIIEVVYAACGREPPEEPLPATRSVPSNPLPIRPER